MHQDSAEPLHPTDSARGPPTAVWAALREGLLSVRRAPEGEGRYVLAQNEPGSCGARALCPLEAAVVSGLSSGLMAKQVAAELGLTPSTVSRVVARAVEKLGFASTTDLLGVLGRLLQPHAGELVAALTDAERQVLRLVQAGFSNREIGARRGRSERTIANQVASLLRKTGLPGRRSLASRVGGPHLAPEPEAACEH